MIRDRGSIKWTSLMLPEHVKELRSYIHEGYYDVPEPSLDEQQMEEMNEMILEAMEFHLPLELTLYNNKRLITITGHVHYMDSVKKHFRILDKSGTLKIVPFSEVKGVSKSET